MIGSGGIKAGKAFVYIEAVDRVSVVLGRVRKKMQDWGREIQNMGFNLGYKAGGLSLPFVKATNTFIEFDDAMRRVQARSKGTKKELTDLRDLAIELGGTTAFTARQVANMQAKIAQKGFSRKEIYEQTGSTLALARGAGEGYDLETDIVQASDLITGTLRAFRMESSKTAQVADYMSVALNSSNYTLEELITSLSYAGPQAENFNLSLDKTLALLGGMRDLNLDASVVGTAFRNMYTYLSSQKKMDKFNEMLTARGGKAISFVDTAGNMRELPDILFAMNKAMDGMGTAEKSFMMSELFGTRAALPATALAKSLEGYVKMLAAFRDGEGEAIKTMQKMEGGLGGFMRAVESSYEMVEIRVGEALDPLLQDIGSSLVDNTIAFGNWAQANKEAVIGVALLIAGFGALALTLLLVGMTLSVISSLMGLLMIPVGIITTLITSTLGLSAAILAFAATPLGALTLALVGLVALLGYFLVDWEKLTDAITGSGIVTAITDIKDTWVSSIKAMANALKAGDIELAWSIMTKQMELTSAQSADAIKDIYGEMVTTVATMIIQAESTYKSAEAFMDELDANLTSGYQEGLARLGAWAMEGEYSANVDREQRSIEALEQELQVLQDDFQNLNPAEMVFDMMDNPIRRASDEQFGVSGVTGGSNLAALGMTREQAEERIRTGKDDSGVARRALDFQNLEDELITAIQAAKARKEGHQRDLDWAQNKNGAFDKWLEEKVTDPAQQKIMKAEQLRQAALIEETAKIEALVNSQDGMNEVRQKELDRLKAELAARQAAGLAAVPPDTWTGDADAKVLPEDMQNLQERIDELITTQQASTAGMAPISRAYEKGTIEEMQQFRQNTLNAHGPKKTEHEEEVEDLLGETALYLKSINEKIAIA